MFKTREASSAVCTICRFGRDSAPCSSNIRAIPKRSAVGATKITGRLGSGMIGFVRVARRLGREGHGHHVESPSEVPVV